MDKVQSLMKVMYMVKPFDLEMAHSMGYQSAMEEAQKQVDKQVAAFIEKIENNHCGCLGSCNLEVTLNSQ